ncbi:hypothetical protein A464_1040 [Salmonella bongori N268-08]|uniref:Uncharacterized protein n=1 Tax=Salmonella bongori N268-08 TaxID=1197719 RepID=S5MNI6_SALBN|nr:hypothetical protein A464_1040 [Salmonella bongori N268-08]
MQLTIFLQNINKFIYYQIVKKRPLYLIDYPRQTGDMHNTTR